MLHLKGLGEGERRPEKGRRLEFDSRYTGKDSTEVQRLSITMWVSFHPPSLKLWRACTLGWQTGSGGPPKGRPLHGVVAELVLGVMGLAMVEEAFVAVLTAIGAAGHHMVKEPLDWAVPSDAVDGIASAIGTRRGLCLSF